MSDNLHTESREFGVLDSFCTEELRELIRRIFLVSDSDVNYLDKLLEAYRARSDSPAVDVAASWERFQTRDRDFEDGRYSFRFRKSLPDTYYRQKAHTAIT